MTTPSPTDLRDELTALADTHSFSPDPSAWDRGRRTRRRDRAIRGAVVAAVVALVAGVGALAVRPDAVAPAGDVRGGAIPSRVPEPDGPVLTDLAIGAASVAYVDTNGMPVLVTATTGEAHWVELPDFPSPEAFELTADFRRGPWLAVSPDGRRLAYPTVLVEKRGRDQSFITAWYRVVDLTTGTSDLVDLPPYSATPLAMSWTLDGRVAIDVYDKGRVNKPVPDVISWLIDPATGEASRSPLTGVLAASGLVSATVPADADPARGVPFQQMETGADTYRPLPTDLYPDGAVVSPVGWVEADVLVASVDPPPSDVVERPRLALITSPDRPGSDAIFREFLPRLPPNLGLSIAVDLIPDLSGDPDQKLTHDFTEAPSMGDSEGGRALYVAGGLVALMAGIVLLLRRVRT